MANLNDTLSKIETIELANGLKVYNLHQQNKPFVQLAAIVHSGCLRDTDEALGTAHYLEHMLCVNSGYPTLNELMNSFADDGGHYNAMTAYGSTGFYFKIPNDSATMKRRMKFLSDICFASPLDQHMERERKVILQEYDKSHESAKLRDAHEAAHASLYTGTQVSRSENALGTTDGINAVTSDVLKDFYTQNYTPSNMSIVCVGGISTNDLVSQLEEAGFAQTGPELAPQEYGSMQKPNSTNLQFDIDPDLPIAQKSCDVSRYVLTNKSNAVGSVYGQSVSQLLMDRLREEMALTYHTYTRLSNWTPFTEVALEVEGVPSNQAEVAAETVLDVLNQTKQHSDLIEATKQRLIIKEKMADRNTDGLFQKILMPIFLQQPLLSSSEYIETINAVTPEDVFSVTDALLGDQAMTVTIHK